MTVHQVSGTVGIGSNSVLGPALVDVSVYVKIAESDEYREVGRGQLVGAPSEAGTVAIEPAAIPVLLRAIAEKYDEALAWPPVDIPTDTAPIETQ